MRASIRQVAARAGVSRTTVSKLLQGRDETFLPETCERVRQAVRELNYIPVSQPMTQTRRSATRTIGLVFGDIEEDDEWGAPLYRGLRHAARAHEYDLLTLLRTPPEWMSDQKELQFLDRRTDGFIFVVMRNQFRMIEKLVGHGVPVVACMLGDVPPGVPAVVLDNAGTMEQAVDYLVARGHRRIAYMHGPDRADFLQRAHGYRSAMTRHSLDACLIPTKNNDVPLLDWRERLVGAIQTKGVTSVVCACDHLAFEVMACLEEYGIRVPQDVSITGLDDSPGGAARGLTTFRCTAPEDFGRLALNILVATISGNGNSQNGVVIPAHIVERSSVATLP